MTAAALMASASTSATMTEYQMPSGPSARGSKKAQPISKTRERMNDSAALTPPLDSEVNSEEAYMLSPISRKAVE